MPASPDLTPAPSQPSPDEALRFDLARTLLIVLVIGALLIGCFLVLAPFLLALVWAAAIVIATWPALTALQQRFGNRRAPAVALLTLALLLLMVVPLTLVVVTIVERVDELAMLGAQLAHVTTQPPPAWLQRLPGSEHLVSVWTQVATLTPQQLQEKITPYASRVAGWLLNEAGSITLLVIQFLLTVMLCAILYMTGEDAARGVRRFAHRLAGTRGDNAVVLAAQAVRAVALGVVVTALVQSILAGVGLALCGIPFAGLLTAVTLLLCVAQIGVFPVLLPAVLWLFWSGDTGWGIFLAIWSLVVGTLDNFLRPWLIRRGADLPMLLILAGVIGGLLAFGIVGLFVGPVLLAVSYRLLEAWIESGEQTPAIIPVSVEIATQPHTESPAEVFAAPAGDNSDPVATPSSHITASPDSNR